MSRQFPSHNIASGGEGPFLVGFRGALILSFSQGEKRTVVHLSRVWDWAVKERFVRIQSLPRLAHTGTQSS